MVFTLNKWYEAHVEGSGICITHPNYTDTIIIDMYHQCVYIYIYIYMPLNGSLKSSSSGFHKAPGSSPSKSHYLSAVGSFLVFYKAPLGAS